MKIAVIGTGISGLTAAYLLHQHHDLTVFEANDYVGGHTHTVPVQMDGRMHSVDTGFIVYNERTYPQFCKLLRKLEVATQPTEMSFSVKCDKTGLEYNGSNLNTLFSQRANLFRLSFHRMIVDILRFNRSSVKLLNDQSPSSNGSEISLGEFLDQHRYSDEFRNHYLIPMGAAIWSTSPEQMLVFPARYFLRFCHNHGLLGIFNRPQWRVVSGGSHNYVSRLIQPFRSRIRLKCPVTSVTRNDSCVDVASAEGLEQFDQVVFATHGDQALRLLADATPTEKEVMSAFRCQRNEAVLHCDRDILPNARRAWASWNYHIPKEPLDSVAVTYQMNILQSLKTSEPISVTLNRREAIRPSKIINSFIYEHPIYTPDAVVAQTRHQEVSGVNRTHFCGAYWGFGFHEDGVKSGIRVAEKLGGTSLNLSS